MKTKRTRKPTMTVAQAIKAAERELRLSKKRELPERTYSHFNLKHVDRYGNLKHDSGWHKNLTTDTASGYTNRRDWQSKAMGGGTAAVASMSGSASSVTANSLTCATANFPFLNNVLGGAIVAVGPVTGSGVGSVAFGVILSSSTTVLNIDQWYYAGSLGVATTPNNSSSYQILPGQMPAMFLALTQDSVAPSSADNVLTAELSTNGFARAVGTWAHSAGATTYTLQKVFNATGTATINKEAVFGSILSGSGVAPLYGGTMPFESAEPNPPTLISGDQLTQTVTVTIN